MSPPDRDESDTSDQQKSNTFSNIEHPKKFDFSSPQSWLQWKKRFVRYMKVSGLQHKDEDEKVNLFIYIMGEEAEEVLLLAKEAPRTLDDAIKHFDQHFIPRKNTIFERFKFNSRVQNPGESIDNFITSLHSLAEHCDYGNLREDLIRDRIVVGMADNKTSERLQLQSTLTLAEAIAAAKQSELQSKQNQILRQENRIRINQVSSQQNKNTHQSSKSGQPRTFQPSQSSQTDKNYKRPQAEGTCKYCGLSSHPRDKCPAKDSSCRTCSKRGHWSKVCRSPKPQKNVRAVNINEDEEEQVTSANNNYFVGQIDSSHGKQWLVNIHINDSFSLDFLVDTGADVVCVPSGSLSQEMLSRIEKCNVTLSGPNGKNLKLVGKINVKLQYKSNIIHSDMYVVDDLKIPILSRDVLLKLKILEFPCDGIQINQVSNQSRSQVEVFKEFPKIFNEIGEFKSEMEIKLQKDAKPFVQSIPRKVPLPL